MLPISTFVLLILVTVPCICKLPPITTEPPIIAPPATWKAFDAVLIMFSGLVTGWPPTNVPIVFVVTICAPLIQPSVLTYKCSAPIPPETFNALPAIVEVL